MVGFTINNTKQSNKGFTIVELLIVVVVIAILAAITIVSYNGISDRAAQTALQAEIRNATQKLSLYGVDGTTEFPATLAEAGIKSDKNTTYQYTTGSGTFNLTASAGKYSYNTSNTDLTPMNGMYSGHSFLIWNKFKPETSPIPAATLDNSKFRTTAPSLRIGAGSTGVALRTSPFTVVAGEVYRVSFWMQSDSGWDGTSNNSKVRYGYNSSNTSCNYNGVKLTWTYVTCGYTVGAGVTSVTVSVGNDGTTGNIWIDDLTVTKQ